MIKRIVNFCTYQHSKAFIVFGIILVCVFFIATSTFIKQTTAYELKDIDNQLKITTENNIQAVDFIFKKYTNSLILAANRLTAANAKSSFMINTLNDLVKLEDFSLAAIVYPDGLAYSADGTAFYPEKHDFTKDMQKGSSFISNVYWANEAIGNAVSVNVPIYDESGEVLAYLKGILSTRSLSKYFNRLFTISDGYYHIVDQNGEYVAHSHSDKMIGMDISFINAIYDLNFDEGFSAETILDSFKDGSEGLIRYSANADGSGSRLAYFSPVGINNWIMLFVFIKEDVEYKIDEQIENGFIYISCVSVVFLLLLAWIVFAMKTEKERADRQQNHFDAIGKYIKKIMFEWDFKTNKLKLLSAKNLLGRDYPNNFIPESKLFELIHPEDHNFIKEGFKTVASGTSVSEIKVRLIHNDGHYIWCSISGIPIYEVGQDLPTKAIGLVEDIDLSLRESIELKKKSELDLLTGIYNKITTEDKIKDILAVSDEKNSNHALFIIDVDNFKTLNDRLGHKVGDDVIKDLAQKTKNIFRADDVVGRVGGDEFFVFMKNMPTYDLVVQKAKEVCSLYSSEYNDGTRRSVQISASIGIALYSKDGADFDSLYKNADIALYASKEAGKNTYTFFNGELNIDYISSRTAIDSAERE